MSDTASETNSLTIDRAPASDPAPGSARVTPVSGLSGWLAVVRELVLLTKPRITLLVFVTAIAGMWVAPVPTPVSVRILSLLGTVLIVSSANALNMWWERDIDGKMSRTRNRPLPAGRLRADVALAFGTGLGVIATPMLYAVNSLTAVLGVTALLTYVLVYTPLKRRSWLALLVGAVPGAMPPLMGWTSATGALEAGGIALFLVLFFWQIPHFAAIALFRRNEYARAGLRVVSVEKGEAGAKRVIFVYTVLLVASSLALSVLHVAGTVYSIVAILSGAAFLALAIRGFSLPAHLTDRARHRWAKQVFAFSILYLVALLATLVANRIVV